VVGDVDHFKYARFLLTIQDILYIAFLFINEHVKIEIEVDAM
jgi:hypothetical protein